MYRSEITSLWSVTLFQQKIKPLWSSSPGCFVYCPFSPNPLSQRVRSRTYSIAQFTTLAHLWLTEFLEDGFWWSGIMKIFGCTWERKPDSVRWFNYILTYTTDLSNPELCLILFTYPLVTPLPLSGQPSVPSTHWGAPVLLCPWSKELLSEHS